MPTMPRTVDFWQGVANAYRRGLYENAKNAALKAGQSRESAIEFARQECADWLKAACDEYRMLQKAKKSE